MIEETTKEVIKTHLKDYLEEKEIKTKGLFNCLNPAHTDNNPSMSYDEKRNIVKCFSCNSSYDLISLYALDNNLDERIDFKKIIDELALKYSVPVHQKSNTSEYKRPSQTITSKKEDYTSYYKKAHKNIDKTTYLADRGISKELIDKYNIGYDNVKFNNTSNNMVVFPISKNCYICRNTDKQSTFKHYKPKGISNELFNIEYLKRSDFKSVIWVCESIIDALSLEEAEKNIKSISLNSINNARQLVDEIKDNDFKGFIVLALDTDAQGIRTSQELKEELELIGIKSFIFNSDLDKYNVTNNEGTKKNKDINEWLLADKEKLTNSVTTLNSMLVDMLEKQALKIYQQTNAFNYLDKFNEYIQDKENNKPLSTGIKTLDQALEGGFYKKNLVIIGAISSLGKTTLALQIADNIAKQEKDVLIFSLEMAKEELIAKSLSRISFLKAYDMHYTALALTTREIMTGKGINEKIPNNSQSVELYKESLEDYKNNIAQNVYITECNETLEINLKSIETRIKEHIAITNNKPFVIVDYLQIIQHQEKGLTDKQAIDKIVTGLKRIARDNDITILLVSAFNRASYNKESGLDSFRDSSTIEYTADVLISLQHEKLDGVTEDKKDKVNTNQEQQKDNRELTLKVLKNRNGRITDVKNITFYAKYNFMHFKEYEGQKINE